MLRHECDRARIVVISLKQETTRLSALCHDKIFSNISQLIFSNMISNSFYINTECTNTETTGGVIGLLSAACQRSLGSTIDTNTHSLNAFPGFPPLKNSPAENYSPTFSSFIHKIFGSHKIVVWQVGAMPGDDMALEKDSRRPISKLQYFGMQRLCRLSILRPQQLYV